MIEIISGTNRPGCNALKVARVLEGIYRQKGVKAQVLDLGELPQEIFHPSSYASKPASFAPFQKRVLAAEGLHVVTPEYNGGYPGVLKYFIDMLKFPESFESRPVAFTGEAAGAWGAIRPVETLQLVFGYRNAYFFPQRVFLSGIGNKLADDGTLSDKDSHDRLVAQCEGFAAFVERNKGEAARA